MANSDESPVAMKLKKMWLKTPSGGVEHEEPPPIIDHNIIGQYFFFLNYNPGNDFVLL